MGFFAPTADFDAFLAEHMSPVMESAGFKRSGRRYTLQGHDGGVVVVHPSLYSPIPTTSFHIDWAAIPAVLRDYIVEDHPKWRPSVKWGLVSTRLRAPIGLQDVSPDLWSFIPEGARLPVRQRRGRMPEKKFGEAFRGVLTKSAIPKWTRALTTEYLSTAYEIDPDLNDGFLTGARWDGPNWMRTILSADEGDHAESREAIDMMGQISDDPIIPWLRERLAARMSPTGSS